MSEGQRALLSYVDLGDMLISGNLNDEGWKKSAESTTELLKDASPYSAYYGIDSSVFQPADTSSDAAAAANDDALSESDNKASGSVVGTGTMIAASVGSAAIGALICFLIVRRKKTGTAA